MAIVLSPMKKHSVAADFLKVYNSVLRDSEIFSKMDPRRVLTVRASGLPFCPHNTFVQRATKGLTNSLDLKGTFYTSVGTAVHETMQSHLGRTQSFIADWHCKECGTWHRFCKQPNCCDFPSEYHEVQIRHKWIVGHIDAIFVDSKGGLWILDFKTTSAKGLPKKLKEPGDSYREQVEAYAYTLKKQYGKTVKGVMLCFIERDNPMKPGMWVKPLSVDFDFPKIQQRLKRYYKMHKQVLDIETKSDVLELLEYKKCTNPWCETCSKSKTKESLKSKLLAAYRFGKAKDHLPIRALVETEIKKQERAARRRNQSK
ncbi:hypothetical protein [Burkholderia phage BCSR5]|nr:hypothetical protein [Burkholderia phage BCSR5]